MVFLAGCQTPLKTSDLSGTVTSAKGPEAGVWVIAETTDLPTRFAKIVVTDDRGRYSLPDMPAANYQVWVRGYGLVDSPKVASEAGRHARSHGGGRAERRRSRGVLPADLLVLDARSSAEERVSHRAGERMRGAPSG